MFGRVLSSATVPGRGRGKARTELRITDGSGHLRVTFFNQPWRERQLPEGSEALFFGKVTDYRGQKQMTNPEVDLVGEEDRLQITALYPQSDKLRLYSRTSAAGWARRCAGRGELVEPLPAWVLDRHDFVDRTAAFRGVHVPESMREAEEARRRLVFDELLRVQLALVLRKRMIEATSQGIEHVTVGRAGAAVPRRAALRAHRRPGEGDRRDRRRPGPARSRCTACCRATSAPARRSWPIAALLTAVQGGHQGAFMAPTEVLAEQHFASMRPMLEGITVPDDGASLFGERPLTVELLTNRVTGKERQRVLGRAGGRRGRPARRHPRAHPGGGRVPEPRRGRDRRAAPLRRRAAGGAAGQGRRRRRCPTCS